MNQPLMFQNAQLYVYGIVFNGINWIFSARSEPAFGAVGLHRLQRARWSSTRLYSSSVGALKATTRWAACPPPAARR